MMTLLEAKHIKKTFPHDKPILKDINLSLESGSMVALIGASGAGKTSLLNILGLLDEHFEGEVLLNSKRVGNLKDVERAKIRNQEIGFILQEPVFVTNLSVRQNILLPRVYATVSLKKKINYTERLKELSEQLGVEKLLNSNPANLSGGQKQRVAAIRALINDPDIILADEPTGSLDESNAQIVVDLLRKMSDEGKGVLTVTHDKTIAGKHDKVLQLKAGYLTEH